eukprot:454069_1
MVMLKNSYLTYIMSNRIHDHKCSYLSSNVWFKGFTKTIRTSNNEKCDLLLLFKLVLFIKYIYYCWFLSFMVCIFCARIKFIRIHNITSIYIFTTTNEYFTNKSYIILLDKHYSTDCRRGYSYFTHLIVILSTFNTIMILDTISNCNLQHFCTNNYWSWSKSLNWGNCNFLWTFWNLHQTFYIGHFLHQKADPKQMTFLKMCKL